MKRCNLCLLPNSLPGSNFSNIGECYWCQTNFPNYKPKGINKLIEEISKNKNGSVDCIVGLSGGKDSSYALYKLKRDLNLNVEAFIYTHSGSTLISVRNAENLCKQLNIKLHKVSLEKDAHLRSFKSFFTAWLKQPSTLKAGITCVACKHLHLQGLEIARRRKIPMIVWSISPLEYSTFLAVSYKPDEKDQFKREGVLKSALVLLKEALKSPELSKAIIKNFKTTFYGCLAAFPNSSYLKKRYPEVTPIMFYDYINWEPNKILNDLETNTVWKRPAEMDEDWHSDCLFNLFKEYMFQKMLGVTYTDAHLSNQIRYGIITKEEALRKLEISKKSLPMQLRTALKKLNLEHLSDRIDFDCFEKEIR